MVMYRLTADPDIPASYTIVTAALVVPVGGILASPFYINSLADNTSYTVRVISDCGTYSLEAAFQTGITCPQITGILEDDLITYWGWDESNDILSEEEIIDSENYQFVTPTQDITCLFNTVSPQYIWMAEPIAVTQKQKWEDTVEPYNHGNIASDQDLFDLPIIIGAFRFYQSVYATQIPNPLKFKVS